MNTDENISFVVPALLIKKPTRKQIRALNNDFVRYLEDEGFDVPRGAQLIRFERLKHPPFKPPSRAGRKG